MNLVLELRGEDSSVDALNDLHDWIRRERLPDVSVKRIQQPPAPGEMGVDLTALSVI